MTNNEINIEEYVYHIGLDHLELYGTFKDDDFIYDKHTKIVNGFYIKKYDVDKYLCKFMFYIDEVSMKEGLNPIGAYYIGISEQAVPTKDYLVIYSAGFRFIDDDKLLFFINQFNITKTKRFDIAIDILLNIDDVLKNFRELSQKGATFNGNNGEVETRYIGEVQNTKNKRQLIRIYNKKVDIIKKRKNLYYQDYLVQEHVTRIELEVRSELSKNIYFLDLFNIYILLGLIKNYFAKHTSLFSELIQDKITLYKKKHEKIDPEMYQSTYYRDYRRKIFLGHAKLVYNLGYCPVRVLIAEGLIKDLTKEVIGFKSFDELLKKEKIVKEMAREDKYIRENLEEILHHYYKYGKLGI